MVRQGIPGRQVLPPKGGPPHRGGRPRPDPLALHPLVPRFDGPGAGADSLHAHVAYGVSAQPALKRTFWSHVTQSVARHGRAPQLVGRGDFNFDLDYPLRARPSVLASLLTRRLVDADLELASALGRDPLCWYHGPEGTRPSRIDGLLVDTRLATLLHAAERLPRGAIPGHTPSMLRPPPAGGVAAGGQVCPPQTSGAGPV